jgi:hypothetical protein
MYGHMTHYVSSQNLAKENMKSFYLSPTVKKTSGQKHVGKRQKQKSVVWYCQVH